MYAGVPSTNPAIVRPAGRSFASVRRSDRSPLVRRERDRLRHAEVGDDDMATINEHVGRLHVAVHNAVRVRIGQRVGHLANDRDDVANGSLPSRSRRCSSDSPSMNGIVKYTSPSADSPAAITGTMCGWRSDAASRVS